MNNLKKEKVSVLSCESYENQQVRRALIKSFELIDFKFANNKKVLIKPNLLGPFDPKFAITTHPVILEELCKILKEKNCKIYIGDSAGDVDKDLFLKTKISYLKKYAELIDFDNYDNIRINRNFGDLKKTNQIPICKLVTEVDLVINVAKLKTHSLTNFTGCVKNLYGTIPGRLKSIYHKTFNDPFDFSLLLLDLYLNIKPELNIIDGISGIEGNGPGMSGIKKESKIIFCSKDALSIDLVAAKTIGFKEKEILTNKIGKEKNLVIEPLIVGENINIIFKKPSLQNFTKLKGKIFSKIQGNKIVFDNEKCIKCHKCEQKCPTKAIKLDPYPECNHKNCIKCYCCMEICPKNAVKIKDHLLIKFIKKIKKIV